MLVDVWRVDLDAGPDVAALDAGELGRAGRLRDEGVRSRFVASRAWLRVILAGYLDIGPAEVRYVVAERGKPAVAGGDICFSLSRSGGLGLVAATRGRAVGVDVEHVRDGVDHDALAHRFFAPAEAAELRRLPEAERGDAFFDMWVRKEAVVKASGAGLGDGVSHLDVRASTVAGRWSLASLDAGRGVKAAVAVEGPAVTHRMRSVTPWQATAV